MINAPAQATQIPVSSETAWAPHPGQQTAFLSSPAYEALFGGAAGPGKSDCLVMEALRQVGNPRYNAILFRRTFPMLEGGDGLIQRSLRWYPTYGGKYNASKHYWTFPSGARIYFGHMQRVSDMMMYQGWQLQYIAFDELTEFEEEQYLYMEQRNRAPIGSGLRCYMRSATNPGNIGHEWVKKRFITTDITNTIRWFAMVNDEDTLVDKSHPSGKSRAFYPAVVSDNPHMDQGYAVNLNNIADPVRRAQLRDGDWDAAYTDGLVYQNWSSTENVTVEAEYKPDVPIIWGIDDGYAHGKGVGTESYHPRVVVLGQMNMWGGIDIFHEYVETGVHNYEQTYNDVVYADSAHTDLRYPLPSMVWMDSSAAMFKGFLWNKGLDVVGATHSVSEGIKNMRQFVCDGNGRRLLRVHPRCTYTIYEFGHYRNDPKLKARVGELVPLKLNDHIMDAIRYMLWHLRHEVAA